MFLPAQGDLTEEKEKPCLLWSPPYLLRTLQAEGVVLRAAAPPAGRKGKAKRTANLRPDVQPLNTPVTTCFHAFS